MATLALVPLPDTPPRKLAPSDWKARLSAASDELWATVRQHGNQRRTHFSDATTYILGDTINWLSDLPPNSIHAVVTDPPYGLIEYAEKNHQKLRAGRGGVWRIPPSFDGAKRQPLPRFTQQPGNLAAAWAIAPVWPWRSRKAFPRSPPTRPGRRLRHRGCRSASFDDRHPRLRPGQHR